MQAQNASCILVMKFYYHLFGSGMGQLELQARAVGDSDWTGLWSRSGNHGDEWYEAQVPFTGIPISAADTGLDGESAPSFEVQFEATRGAQYLAMLPLMTSLCTWTVPTVARWASP